ncbi:hypothetical protein CBL_20776 [Carabus blaptoides fortunei]
MPKHSNPSAGLTLNDSAPRAAANRNNCYIKKSRRGKFHKMQLENFYRDIEMSEREVKQTTRVEMTSSTFTFNDTTMSISDQANRPMIASKVQDQTSLVCLDTGSRGSFVSEKLHRLLAPQGYRPRQSEISIHLADGEPRHVAAHYFDVDQWVDTGVHSSPSDLFTYLVMNVGASFSQVLICKMLAMPVSESPEDLEEVGEGFSGTGSVGDILESGNGVWDNKLFHANRTLHPSSSEFELELLFKLLFAKDFVQLSSCSKLNRSPTLVF